MQRLNKISSRSQIESSFYAGLYDTLHYRLLQEGKRLCKDDSLVEDSIHDIFLQFINKKEDFNHVINIESYLIIVLRRKIIQKLGKGKNIVSIDAIEESMDIVSHELVLVEDESLLSQSHKLRRALNQLTKSESHAIEKRFFNGLTYEEIASLNNSTIRTVYNQIHSGIKKMRSMLKV